MFTMANIAAFHLLYTYAILSLCQRHCGQHWTLNKLSSSCIRPIQLSGDLPLLPGGTVGYPAQPGLMCVSESVSQSVGVPFAGKL